MDSSSLLAHVGRLGLIRVPAMLIAESWIFPVVVAAAATVTLVMDSVAAELSSCDSGDLLSTSLSEISASVTFFCVRPSCSVKPKTVDGHASECASR